MPASSKSIVKDNFLVSGGNRIRVGSPRWFEWLSSAKSFSFKSQGGNFLARREKRRNQAYWYAYRRSGKLRKFYLGKSENLTPERLDQACISLTGQGLLEKLADQSGEKENLAAESRIDTSILPLTKVTGPISPRRLIARPRLTHRINTPLTLIYAPSGFGKSTLLVDWKQTCGHPVAWLSLDDSDNNPVRFWRSLIMALQTVHESFGRELSAYLGTSSAVPFPEFLARLTNELLRHQAATPHLGLVLDDFHHINRFEIYDSIQTWLEDFPANLQLVISGHTKPPLSLDPMRAKGLVSELDADDLRFTLEEGIDFLRQSQQENSLVTDDLARLVKRSEGWAAGLALTALALGKRENQRQFVDTFSGAHIYLREYFMDAVLEHTSPEVQAFLLRTAILKQLTGSLCDAVTTQTGGDEMLLHLWQENIFIVRLKEQGWFRYHDLFAEMLLSQLQIRYPGEISELHRRAARWYRAQNAPGDAIYHLLGSKAWEEAALLMEEIALRELEQYGEDSRLLHWLQELPAEVVQKHKKLLFVYLRLAAVALPQQKIKAFIDQIEANLSVKTIAQQNEDERDVLTEIQQIQRAWKQGDPFRLPSRSGNVNDAKWELLNGIHLIGQVYEPFTTSWEAQVASLLRKAQAQSNLYVLLMSGGSLARRAFIKGQFRRSEKIARIVLEQALARRGKLPETASIALATLSQIYLERNDLEQAEKFLAQALEADPNPTSSNMPVQIAIQRAELQMTRCNFAEAFALIESIRELHARRPSGVWTDQDLLAYEAYISVREGDGFAAEQILNEWQGIEGHGLTKLVRAEILLIRNQAGAAEKQFDEILSKYPDGILWQPLMRTRLLLAAALFEQHKMNRALRVIQSAVRLAAPEQFSRPFLEAGVPCMKLLALALETGGLSEEAQTFIENILELSPCDENNAQISPVETASLSAAASISPRELEVLRWLSAGYTYREIAQKLSISESTVKTHVRNIYGKLKVNSRLQAVNYAKELKLVP